MAQHILCRCTETHVKFDEIYAFVEAKPAVVGNRDLVSKDCSNAEFSIPGYVVYRQDRTDRTLSMALRRAQ